MTGLCAGCLADIQQRLSDLSPRLTVEIHDTPEGQFMEIIVDGSMTP